MREETRKLFEKAERALKAARTLSEQDADFAVARAYYALFYVAAGLLAEQKLHFRKHGAVHAAFGEHFVKSGAIDAKFHRWLLDAFDKRVQADYGLETKLTQQDAAAVIDQAQEFLLAARQHLQHQQ